MNLGPLQAIEKGYVPYVGPASSQYGPGSQILTYAVMKWSGRFDLLSYRAAGAWLHLLTAFGICAAAVYLLDGWMLVPVLLLALAYSPLGFFGYQENGSLEGFYGWANGLRYMGCMIALGGLPAAVRRGGAAQWALGAVFGLFCFLSQENLGTAATGGAMLVALLWLTGTASIRSLAWCLGRAACGFIAVWIPVALFFLAQGAFGGFVRSYLLFGAGVANGFLNSWWLSPANSSQYRSYLYTGVILAAIGAWTLFDARERRLRGPLDRRQARLLGFVCAAAAAYAVSLLRSDSWHTRNTTVALPFVLLLAFWDLPQWSARPGWRRWAIRAAIAGMALWVYPLIGAWVMNAPTELRAPLRRFAADRAPVSRAADPRIPFQRVTRYLTDDPPSAEGGMEMRVFLEEMIALHEIAGRKKTMVIGVPGLYPGVVSFVADLTPAPHFLAREMIMPNMLRESLEFLRAHIGNYECIVTEDLEEPESALFRRLYPDARVVTRHLGEAPYYVLVR